VWEEALEKSLNFSRILGKRSRSTIGYSKICQFIDISQNSALRAARR
jgi:hypothetical protein